MAAKLPSDDRTVPLRHHGPQSGIDGAVAFVLVWLEAVHTRQTDGYTITYVWIRHLWQGDEARVQKRLDAAVFKDVTQTRGNTRACQLFEDVRFDLSVRRAKRLHLPKNPHQNGRFFGVQGRQHAARTRRAADATGCRSFARGGAESVGWWPSTPRACMEGLSTGLYMHWKSPLRRHHGPAVNLVGREWKNVRQGHAHQGDVRRKRKCGKLRLSCKIVAWLIGY